MMEAPALTPAQLAEGLGHSNILERERAGVKLKKALCHPARAADAPFWVELEDAAVLLTASDLWTRRLGGVTLATALVGSRGDAAFADVATQLCVRLLEDSEPRVRLAVGKCMGALARARGMKAWNAVRGAVLGSIERCWDRDASSYERQLPGAGELRHGTEGWRGLETSFWALQQLAEGCGPAFANAATPELRSLLLRGLHHPNRFVREAGYHTLAALCACAAPGTLDAWGTEAAARLQDGLSENWSQVRYAACVAARAFMLAAGEARAAHYPVLLPALCFNRHDVAEGVRAYSADTWRLVLGSEGPAWVARCLPQVLDYYGRCARTNNHTVREAACACVGELAAKVPPGTVAPQVPRMLRLLVTCLRDDSWPVRSAAALAAGCCAAAFPEEAAPWRAELWPLLRGLLDDNVPSVREDGAIALADAVRAWGVPMLDLLLPALREMLPRAKEQPPDPPDRPGHTDAAGTPGAAPSAGGPAAASASSSAAEGLGSGPASGTAASVEESYRRIPLDATRPGAGLANEERALFHSGTLTRAKRDTGGVDYSCGCMDYGLRRAREPWEASDGAACALAELADGAAPAAVPEFLPALAEVARLDHFRRCRQLQETVWRGLPRIAAGLGKRAFKPHLEPFLEPLFRSLACGHQLCRVAAGACLGALRDWLGPRILAGRLSDAQVAAMAASPDVPPPAGVYALRA
ncbi:hypothetical protein WJX81_002074 [Elliptochloris bilobata]|uniref:Uncharacterized protein n=1 Tax=Elliptochloris bilobata TaxID=381761 RepID=A0AAW1QZ66_9CHLO